MNMFIELSSLGNKSNSMLLLDTVTWKLCENQGLKDDTDIILLCL